MAHSFRPPSAREAPHFATAAHRKTTARAFSNGARDYDDARPGYPAAVVDFFLAGVNKADVVDIGAGTGKLTAALAADSRAQTVTAVDPSPAMTRVLRAKHVPAVRASAEHTALADAHFHLATLAQTWHWVDVAAASRELDRIVRPGGRVGLVWNTVDVNADPWVLRLARIMHSGDIHRPGFVPEVGAPWQVARDLRTGFVDTLTPEQMHTLMHTRSYWLKANEKTRARMTANLDWYLYEHLGFAPGQPVELPYRTDAFVLERA
ncbi:class I SAM-dependent methyltransferase [Corynebacterium massiliense]|uniref:class I SAM-dependent methyltransferase n=1 Tax=Corynebacterium massiliense TaxID=441501 RepID=UPI00235689D4|nr:class I SAM-dependent methyltransferase [Corynebacterium massiliense]